MASFWQKARQALTTGMKRGAGYQPGRSLKCMTAEANHKPCHCGHAFCRGDGPW